MEHDFIDRMAGLTSGHAVHALRHRRDKLAAATQAFHDMYFDGQVDGLSKVERLLVAWQVSRLTPARDTAEFFRAQLESHAIDTSLQKILARIGSGNDSVPADAFADPRQAALARFAGVLATRPVDGDRDLLMTLPAAGVSTPGIIAAAQLIAYVAWQTRVVAALKALTAAGEPAAPVVGAWLFEALCGAAVAVREGGLGAALARGTHAQRQGQQRAAWATLCADSTGGPGR